MKCEAELVSCHEALSKAQIDNQRLAAEAQQARCAMPCLRVSKAIAHAQPCLYRCCTLCQVDGTSVHVCTCESGSWGCVASFV